MENISTQSHATLARISGKRKKLLAALSSLPPWARACFVIALLALLGSSLGLVLNFNARFLTEVPRTGGALSEGVIGRPRFINPVIAKSDVDRDMVALIYSGLLKATPEGSLVNDLAKNYTISEDGLTYTFTLKDTLFWHDGTPITSEDVRFTIEKVRDPALAIKSPRRASWEGVEVSTPDAATIVFTLKQPYAPFLENATMGILPKHIWQNVPDEEFDISYYNIEPIGSGPYRIASILRDNDKGLPRHYELLAFKRYALGEPYITNVRIQFFGNNQELEQAYNDGTIDQMHTIAPSEAKALEARGKHIERTPLPRIFAAFFNQNQQPIFADKAVRQALDLSVDKQRIVDSVLSGYGKPINDPLPFLGVVGTSTLATSTEGHIAAARAVLESAGWQLNAANIYEKTDKKKKKVSLLQFSIAMPDIPELKSVAEAIKNDWEKMGARVTLRVFDPSTFATEVLAPRKYDVLFYGAAIAGRVPDPFPYWHSSERNAPGVNVALYTNKTVDKLLEDARKESDEMARTLTLTKFVNIIKEDTPAVFIYSPDFLYATSPRVRGMHIGMMTTESERFLDIATWYVESERVWKIFTKEKTEG